MMKLPKFTIGVGDRFGRQGKAQLSAFIEASRSGVEVCPVWNKSNREHQIIGSKPLDVRVEADNAVKELKWNKPYFVDADHINDKNLDAFLDPCDFFTIDVADYVGKSASDQVKQSFLSKHKKFFNQTFKLDGIELFIREEDAKLCAEKYLQAILEAGKIFRRIEQHKGKDNFVVEVSMDETDEAQRSGVLFFILAAIADEKIPAQTIAPKFTGRFNKGVDYVGNLEQFKKEFIEDIAVIGLAKKEFICLRI